MPVHVLAVDVLVAAAVPVGAGVFVAAGVLVAAGVSVGSGVGDSWADATATRPKLIVAATRAASVINRFKTRSSLGLILKTPYPAVPAFRINEALQERKLLTI
jgi:hypothetical protein